MLLVKYNLLLRVETSFSLKDKRSVISRIKTALCKKNILIIEQSNQDDIINIGLSIAFYAINKDDLQDKINKLSAEIEECSGGYIYEEEYDYL